MVVEPPRPILSWPAPATSPDAVRAATKRPPTFSTASRGPFSPRATTPTRTAAAAISRSATNLVGPPPRADKPGSREPRIRHARGCRLQGLLRGGCEAARDHVVRVRPGAWRIYALDSECAVVGGCGSSSPQGRWLAADRRGTRVVVSLRSGTGPLFSSGLNGGHVRMAWMWRTLDAAGAELVVSGHDHDYERFARKHSDGTAAANGVRQFVVGTGGAGAPAVRVGRPEQRGSLEREPRRPTADAPPSKLPVAICPGRRIDLPGHGLQPMRVSVPTLEGLGATALSRPSSPERGCMP